MNRAKLSTIGESMWKAFWSFFVILRALFSKNDEKIENNEFSNSITQKKQKNISQEMQAFDEYCLQHLDRIILHVFSFS